MEQGLQEPGEGHGLETSFVKNWKTLTDTQTYRQIDGHTDRHIDRQDPPYKYSRQRLKTHDRNETDLNSSQKAQHCICEQNF